MQGAGCEAVVLHREGPATKQMPQDQLACKVKYVCIILKSQQDKSKKHAVTK